MVTRTLPVATTLLRVLAFAALAGLLLASAGACARPGAAENIGTGSDGLPTAAPAGWVWEPIALSATWSQAVPTDPAGAGPRERDDTWAAGWDHSPHGALAAAAWLTAATDVNPRQVDTHALPGPYTTAARQFAEFKGHAAAPSSSATQIGGFRFRNYSPAAATVDWLLVGAGSRWMLASTTVEWADGDWRILMGPDRSMHDPQSVDAAKVPPDIIRWSAP